MIQIKPLGTPVRAYQVVGNVRALPAPIKRFIVGHRYGEDQRLPPSQLLVKTLIRQLREAQIPVTLAAHVRPSLPFTPDQSSNWVSVLPPAYVERLRTHQRDMLPLCLTRKRFLIADDVGLGKTVTALAALNAAVLLQPKLSRVLIVTLKNLIPQWEEAAIEWLLPDVLRRLDIICTNWDQLRLPVNNHWPLMYSKQVVILDEAHAIKNRQSQRSQAAKRLTRGVEYVWMLTGTPVEKAPDDMWHLLHCIEPRLFSSYWAFRDCFVKEARSKNGQPIIIGPKNVPILHDVVKPWYQRHTRALLGITEPQIIEVPYRLNAQHLSEYKHLEKAVWSEVKDKPITNAVSRLVYLRQCALHPMQAMAETQGGKFEVLSDIISMIGDYKFVIFTSFRWAARLAHQLTPHTALYEAGDDSTILQRFREDASLRGLVSTTFALGVGHNLQTANVIILLDLPQSRTQYVQAVGRVVRMGQQNPPIIYHIVAAQTVDKHAANRLKRKHDNFSETLLVDDWRVEMEREYGSSHT